MFINKLAHFSITLQIFLFNVMPNISLESVSTNINKLCISLLQVIFINLSDGIWISIYHYFKFSSLLGILLDRFLNFLFFLFIVILRFLLFSIFELFHEVLILSQKLLLTHLIISMESFKTLILEHYFQNLWML